MKQFLKFTFASILGFFISFTIIIFFILLFTFAIASTLSKTETVNISENTILELQLDYNVPERSTYEPLFNYSLMPSMGKTLGLNDIIKLLNDAKYNYKIKGLFLDLDNLWVGGISKINSIRNALVDFKSSGKFIYAHGNSISEQAYYLASVADSIFLTPTGNLEYDGFGFEITFFKNLLKKLEIEQQIFQYGKFKGATEPYRLEKLSTENRQQLSKYLNSVYNYFSKNISNSTGIELLKLKDISKNLMVNSAEDALSNGLVDQLFYKDQVDSLLKNRLNNNNKLKTISAEKYITALSLTSSTNNNRIAVIYALGEIINGEGDEFTIGTSNIIKSIRRAGKNNKVKAIVMRVNSPGGSPLTSDMIWREIELASANKPFVVSMGDVAASGGYYISCNADLIVAEPTTLTGSIGVYGMIPNTQKFFNNKLGITFDRVETNKNTSLMTIASPLSEQQKISIQEQIDDIYFDFVSRVANGRKMTFNEVDNISEGRIWSGLEAKNIGLVDTLGGINLALELAAERANIEDYKIIEYPTQKEAFEKIIDILAAKIENSIDNNIFNYPLNQFTKISEALKYTGIQVRLPFEYVIR